MLRPQEINSGDMIRRKYKFHGSNSSQSGEPNSNEIDKYLEESKEEI